MSKIISAFQMKKNSVVSFDFKQMELSEEYETTHITFGADYEISDVTENDEVMSSRVDLLISLIGKTNHDELVFEINLDMMGIFFGDKEQVKKEEFLNMLKINGLSTLMQLSRAYVTASTALSGFSNPINFPMVNVFELVKSKEEN